MLNLNKTTDGNNVTYKLEGRLDTISSPELENVLKGCIESIDSLCFDCEKLEYISSAGLRVLLSAQKALGDKGKIKLTHVNEAVNEVFEVTGFINILDIEN